MKTIPRQLLFGVALACFSALTLTSLAEDTPPGSPDQTTAQPAATTTTSTAIAPQDSAATATTTPAPSADAEIKAAEQAATAPAAPAAPAADAAPTATSSDSSLRRLDASSEPAAPVSPQEPVAPAAPRRRNGHGGGNERVSMFGDATLRQGETSNAVVAVIGNATSDGTVGDSVVAVVGNARATGPVRNSVVAVAGNAYVDSRVGEVVAVFGNVELGPNAEVMRDVTCVGGTVKRDPKAIVHGQIPNVQFAPFNMGDAAWLHAYLTNCVMKARPLAIAPNLGWAWMIAIGFLLLYVVFALLFRGGIETTVRTLETRPGGSVLAALLTALLTPVLFVLLCVTVVGIAVVPFLAIALVCASLFGKATMLAWIGRRITRLFGDGPLAHPAFGVLIGGIIVLALYLVPVVGFITYKLLGFVGLGVVVYTLLLASKRNKPPRATRAAAVPSPVVPPGAAEPVSGFAAAGESEVSGGGAAVAEAVVAPPVTTAAPAVPLAALPRAGFWIRMGALAIDVILVAVVLGMFSGVFPRGWHGPNLLLPILAIYGAVLWKLRGTTIGGIICGLRVVRVDGRELDWPTVVVRALSCFLSLVVVGLGFIWVAIDEEKQSWHDKIAGTTVVFARNGQALV